MIWCVGYHHSEVSPSGATDDSDAVGVDLEFLGIHPEPTNRIFTIVEIIRPAASFSCLVIDTDAEIAHLSEGGASDKFAFAVLISFHPTSAVDDDDGRSETVFVPWRRLVEVELFSPFWGEESEVALNGNSRRRFSGRFLSLGCSEAEKKREKREGER